MDEEYWGDPKVFRPERFLSPDEKKFRKDERRVAIFGFGKWA
jgi:cytochrome P450